MLAEYKTKEQKKKFYNSSKWKNNLRLQALKRDNNECQQCKQEGRVHFDSIKGNGEKKKIELNVHHIKEIEHHPELAYELSNLETLCVECHNKIHGKTPFGIKINKWNDEKW